MGNICGSTYKEDANISSVISDGTPTPDIPKERVKFLLLGAGESGKSTLFKQMKINYVNTYSKASLVDEKSNILKSVLVSFKDLLEALREVHGHVSDDLDLQEIADELFPAKSTNPPPTRAVPRAMNKKVYEFMKTIWASDRAQELWATHNLYSVTDSLDFFMNDLDRIYDEGYVPTEIDFLKSRVTTVGVIEQTFQYKGVLIYVVDVGGQRNERKKWVTMFEGVSAILFVASLSEFDQKLFEDNRVDRLPEAKELFRKTLNFLIFRSTPFVLFLNKQDLLKEKLEKMEAEGRNLDDFFPDLGLGTNYTNALQTVQEHLKAQFLSVCTAEQQSRVIPHFITAIDKGSFKKIFQAAAQVVLRQAINEHFKLED